MPHGERQRIAYVDVMKGIGILLVIIGHTVNIQMLRGLIFSFHMPLFFFASGITYQYSANLEKFLKKLKNGFFKLFFPAFLLYLLRYVILGMRDHNWLDIRQFLSTLFFASGVEAPLAHTTVQPIGAVWFLVALFICRWICDGIHLGIPGRAESLVVCALCLTGVIVGNIRWLPLSLDIAMAATIFFHAGKMITANDSLKRMHHPSLLMVMNIIGGGCGLMAEFFLTHKYLILARRQYPAFPLSFLTAFFFLIAVTLGSVKITQYHFLKRLLSFLGKNSMKLFMIHYFDLLWQPIWEFSFSNGMVNQFISSVLRVGCNLFILLAFAALTHHCRQKKRCK